MLQVYFKNKPDTVTDGCFANRMQNSGLVPCGIPIEEEEKAGKEGDSGVYSELGSSVKGAW